MERANATLYLSVRRSGCGGERRKHRRCSRMELGSGTATLGICKVMGHRSKGKCASRWVSPRKGKRCEETKKWSTMLKYPCTATHVGRSTRGGGGAPVVNLLPLENWKTVGAHRKKNDESVVPTQGFDRHNM